MMQSAVSYDDRPIAQTHPALLARTARSWGLRPADSQRARVLEVGCAHGVNLMAMAARMPDAAFVGLDIDAACIEVARARARDAGLPNVSFEHADVVAYRAGQTFDYVIAHGVLSWVSAEAGDAIFRLCNEGLSPQGIAYISYDAKPGACLRDALGLGLRASNDAEAALALLRGNSALVGSLQGAWLDAEIDAARSQPRSYLQQQFLSPHQRAFAVSEVWDWAARHGLQYVDDVAETGLDPSAVQSVRADAAAQTPDRRSAEQLLDTAILRQFRASVFTRSSAALEPTPVPEPKAVSNEVPRMPRVHALSRLEARELGFVSTVPHGFRPLHPLHAMLVEALDGTRDIEALASLVVDGVAGGTLSLPTADGSPASVEEARAGAPVVVEAALRELGAAGLFVPS